MWREYRADVPIAIVGKIDALKNDDNKLIPPHDITVFDFKAFWGLKIFAGRVVYPHSIWGILVIFPFFCPYFIGTFFSKYFTFLP